MEFGQWLADQLKVKSITQRELARRSGVAQANISRVIHGKLSPTRDFCAAISKGLGIRAIEVMQLAGYEDVPLVPYGTLIYEIARACEELTPAQREHTLALIKMIKDGTLPYLPGKDQTNE